MNCLEPFCACLSFCSFFHFFFFWHFKARPYLLQLFRRMPQCCFRCEVPMNILWTIRLHLAFHRHGDEYFMTEFSILSKLFCQVHHCFPLQISQRLRKKEKKNVLKKCCQDLQNYPILTLFSCERTLTNPGTSVKNIFPTTFFSCRKNKST